MCDLFTDADVIHTYSRAEAIADGMLVDVTVPARRLGILYPLAVSARAWAALVEYPGADQTWALQSVLCVVVAQLRRARAAGQEGDRLPFQVQRRGRPQAVVLHCGPGDDLDPVLTLLLDGED
jgi:hypothetical protein